MKTILIAGGGTGGHVFPGLAVAQALTELADVEIVFAGSPRGLETRVVPAHGFALELLEVEPMKGGGAARAVRGALVAAKAMRYAVGMIGRLRPSAVLSMGGYAAGPASLAAVRLGIPLAILEPNSTLGLTNRMLAPFARRGYVAWSETAKHFRGDKARLYGVPLRASFSPRPYCPKSGTRRVLILGGSQGASALNERIPRAIARVVAEIGELEVVHQTGAARQSSVQEAYNRLGIAKVTVTPFVEDVAAQMALADVVVARGGAVTVAELAAIGRASILVPFPHAADDHQAKNAMALAERGGAIALREEVANEIRIAAELTRLLSDDKRRITMAHAAREQGHPYAATKVARDLLILAGIRLRPVPKAAKNGTHGSNGANGGANGRSSFHLPTSKVVS